MANSLSLLVALNPNWHNNHALWKKIWRAFCYFDKNKKTPRLQLTLHLYVNKFVVMVSGTYRLTGSVNSYDQIANINQSSFHTFRPKFEMTGRHLKYPRKVFRKFNLKFFAQQRRRRNENKQWSGRSRWSDQKCFAPKMKKVTLVLPALSRNGERPKQKILSPPCIQDAAAGGRGLGWGRGGWEAMKQRAGI